MGILQKVEYVCYVSSSLGCQDCSHNLLMEHNSAPSEPLASGEGAHCHPRTPSHAVGPSGLAAYIHV